MIYTLEKGYDSELKKRVEKSALYALPLAIVGIVAFASLTSNSTTGGGIGSPSKGTGGNGSVATTWTESGDGQQLVSSTVGTSVQNGGSGGAKAHASPSATNNSAAASNPTGSSVSVSPGRGGGETTVTTPVTPPVTVPDPVPTGGGSDGSGGSTTIVPVVPLPVTVCTKHVLDVVTGQEVCVN
jgi:hypothetical protein